MLSSGEPDYTRVVPCQCTQGEPEESRLLRLRRDSGDLDLKLLRNMTFENFDCKRINLPPDEQDNLEWVFRTARKFAKEPEGWLILMGLNGCGKTHLAAAIGNYRLRKGEPVLFVFVPDFLDHLRSSFMPESKTTYDELFERVRVAPLLILDDFGEQASTPWAHEKVYQIINYRYNERIPTVITTCLSLDDMEPRVGSRLADTSLCTPCNIMAPDYRSGPGKRGKRKQS